MEYRTDSALAEGWPAQGVVDLAHAWRAQDLGVIRSTPFAYLMSELASADESESHQLGEALAAADATEARLVPRTGATAEQGSLKHEAGWLPSGWDSPRRS